MATEHYNFSYKQIWKTTLQALDDLEIEVKDENFDEGYIEAAKGGSFLSWGEKIELDVRLKPSGEVAVSVNSASKAQLVDWGSNSSNEKNILGKINELLSLE